MSVDLPDILGETCRNLLAKSFEQEELNRQACDEFRAIDFGRLLFDRDYQRRLDQHFGEGWENRIRFMPF